MAEPGLMQTGISDEPTTSSASNEVAERQTAAAASPSNETAGALMAEGFLQTVSPTLNKCDDLLNELLSKQQMLLDKFVGENERISNNEAVKKVHSTMIRTQQYYKKLQQMRKDMLEIHAKSSKLKARALKLEESELKKANERKLQQQKLIAKPATSK